jgi:hypothetical protein
MSHPNKYFGNYLLYSLIALLIALLIAATIGVYRNVIDKTFTGTLIAAISAMASCASAGLSLYVANRTQKMSENQRQAERDDVNAKIRHNRQRIAAHYAAEIRAWLRRRDLHKFFSDLGLLKSKPDILGPMEILLAGRQSNRKFAGQDISAKDDSRDSIVWQARRIAGQLALSSFANFRRIPSIWTVLFRREDTEVLGEGAMVFFISMKSVWINLTLATAQIPSSDEVVEFVNGQQPEYAIKYLGKLFDQVFVLRYLFKVFTTTATQCAEWLERNGSENDPLAAMFVPEGLENGSRDAAFDWSDISSEIQLDETLERWRSAQKDSHEFLGRLDQARDGADKYEQMLKGFADEQRRFLKDQPNDTQLSDEPKP